MPAPLHLPFLIALTLLALLLASGAASAPADGAAPAAPPPGALGGALADPCPDADGDLYADCRAPGCAPGALPCGDCDDADPLVHPGATETCNHVADACGAVDQGFPPLVSAERIVDRHPAAYDGFGFAAVSLGDVDGDAVADFAIGSPADDLVATDGGSVTLYSGATREILCRHAPAEAGARLGETLAVVGDLDGDGRADLAAAAPAHNFVALISSADCGEIARCVDPDGASRNMGGDHGLAAFDDVTGDGLAEILVGADSSNVPLHYGGRAMVFSPAAGGGCSLLFTLADPALAIYAYLGFAMARVDDVSGDGVADIAVGEPGDDHQTSSAGSVLIFSGADGTFLARRLDPAGVMNNRLGEAVVGFRDYDGDGVGDLLAGAPRRSTTAGAGAGEILVLSGATGSVLARLHDPDGTSSAWFGASIAILPDTNGDGTGDILAGAPRTDRPDLADAGRAVVLSGADGAWIGSFEDTEGAAGDQLGFAIASAGDLSGDGVPEILAGAPYRDLTGRADAGTILVFALETDCDADGLGPFGGDCNDADANLWRFPSEARNLALAGVPSLITWDPPVDPGQGVGVVLYDTLRATAAADFAGAACIETAEPDLTTIDAEAPAPGAAFFYLVRARNGCGPGSPGRDSAGDPRPAPVCP